MKHGNANRTTLYSEHKKVDKAIVKVQVSLWHAEYQQIFITEVQIWTGKDDPETYTLSVNQPDESREQVLRKAIEQFDELVARHIELLPFATPAVEDDFPY